MCICHQHSAVEITATTNESAVWITGQPCLKRLVLYLQKNPKSSKDMMVFLWVFLPTEQKTCGINTGSLSKPSLFLLVNQNATCIRSLPWAPAFGCFFAMLRFSCQARLKLWFLVNSQAQLCYCGIDSLPLCHSKHVWGNLINIPIQ